MKEGIYMKGDSRAKFTIKLGGVDYTGHFSLNFWAEIGDLRNHESLEETLYEFKQGFTVSKIRDIIYCSVNAYSEDHGEEKKFTHKNQVGLLMEDITPKDVSMVVDSMIKSQMFKPSTAQEEVNEEGEEVKKK